MSRAPNAGRGRFAPITASLSLALPLLPLTAVIGCGDLAGRPQGPRHKSENSISTILIGTEVLHTGVKRFGINLSGQTGYDSGQMLRNLSFRNPGFEGETWQSILHCKVVTPTSCIDEDKYSTWPSGFLDGAHYEFISGYAKGSTGTVASSTIAGHDMGATLNLRSPRLPPAVGDFLIVSIDKPGVAQAGWWTNATGGASFATEMKDLSPNSPGKQALRIEASAPGASAAVTSYFDTWEGRSFVQLHGLHTITFRAKSLGSASVEVKVQRLATAHGDHVFLSQTIQLSPQWQDYQLQFTADERGSEVGPVAMTFRFAQCSALLDDVALTAPASPGNPTVFRDEVVAALRDLHPGVLRYMDASVFGSSLDNLLAVPFARRRAGFSTQKDVQEDVPIGLHEFLVLAQAVGAEPWFSMPAGTSAIDAAHLAEYLGGAPSTPYGAHRAALGQKTPWTDVFPVIHLEVGNEVWNTRSFAGATMSVPEAFGTRSATIRAAIAAVHIANPARLDFVLGSWAAVPYWTEQELKGDPHATTVAIAPYLFNTFNDNTSPAAIFGPMLAQPEMLDSRPTGYTAQQRRLTPLAVYEVNMSPTDGTANLSQQDLDQASASLGSSLAVLHHMLLMLRDLDVTTQSVFSLSEFVNAFSTTKKKIPLWGSVIDMGGQTNRRRPQYLAEKMVNAALYQNMLTTRVLGNDPVIEQKLSTNDQIQLKDMHLLQTFAFTDGERHSLILFNLSLNQTIPVQFEGASRPQGTVEENQLTSAHISDTNEQSETVAARTRQLPSFNPAATYNLPPFSLTVLRWQTSR